jgi:hypothetical protein
MNLQVEKPGGCVLKAMALAEYTKVTMSITVKNEIRREVLNYVKGQQAPVSISHIADELRQSHSRLSAVTDSGFRDIVQPMIVTGKLSYAPGLKIKLGKATE